MMNEDLSKEIQDPTVKESLKKMFPAEPDAEAPIVPAPPPLTEEQKAKQNTLDVMLGRLAASDEDILGFDVEVLLEDINLKVDNYKRLIDRYEASDAMFRKQADELYAAATTCKNKARRIKEIMLFNLKKHGYEKLPGVYFRVQINENHGHEVIDQRFQAPDAMMAIAYPEFIKVKYETDRTAMYDAFKLNPEGMKLLVKDRVTEFAQFYVNTGSAKPKEKKGAKK